MKNLIFFTVIFVVASSIFCWDGATTEVPYRGESPAEIIRNIQRDFPTFTLADLARLNGGLVFENKTSIIVPTIISPIIFGADVFGTAPIVGKGNRSQDYPLATGEISLGLRSNVITPVIGVGFSVANGRNSYSNRAQWNALLGGEFSLPAFDEFDSRVLLIITETLDDTISTMIGMAIRNRAVIDEVWRAELDFAGRFNGDHRVVLSGGFLRAFWEVGDEIIAVGLVGRYTNAKRSDGTYQNESFGGFQGYMSLGSLVAIRPAVGFNSDKRIVLEIRGSLGIR